MGSQEHAEALSEFFAKIRDFSLHDDDLTLKSIKQLELHLLMTGLDKDDMKDATVKLMECIPSGENSCCNVKARRRQLSRLPKKIRTRLRGTSPSREGGIVQSSASEVSLQIQDDLVPITATKKVLGEEGSTVHIPLS